MNIKPARILVPTDFSSASDRAISLARAVARPLGAEIHQLHVRVLLDHPDTDSETLDEIEKILVASEPGPLDNTEGIGKNGSIPIFTHMKRGTVAADGIVEAVFEYDCDLVVMGTHGRRGFRRLLTGSVAREIVQRSPVPVLTTRCGVGPVITPKKILAAVDFSGDSLKAVEYAGAWASAMDAEIMLMHVFQPMVYPEFYGIEALTVFRRKEIVQRCHESLVDVATRVLADVPFSTVVVEGHVTDRVSRFANENDFDLVVLGTRGLSGLSHTLLGSAAERLVGLSEVPVLTIRLGS